MIHQKIEKELADVRRSYGSYDPEELWAWRENILIGLSSFHDAGGEVRVCAERIQAVVAQGGRGRVQKFHAAFHNLLAAIEQEIRPVERTEAQLFADALDRHFGRLNPRELDRVLTAVVDTAKPAEGMGSGPEAAFDALRDAIGEGRKARKQFHRAFHALITALREA